jgi:gliding motility-associated-like protein
VFTGLAPGTYYLTITDSKGCTKADSATLAAADTVVLSVVPVNGQVKLGDSLQLTSINNQPGNVTYLWTPNIGLSCYDCPDPVFNGIYSEPYTVQVTNDSGCVSTFTFNVTVLPDYDFFIPNAFTPNGDGKNDYWQIYGSTNTIKQLNVMVFDRIGEKVFESDDVNFSWDGMYRGQYVAQGVYVYAMKIVWLDNRSDDMIKGSITILR